MKKIANKKVVDQSKLHDIVVYPGEPYPLGATWDGEGVNFALYSENATGVDLAFLIVLRVKQRMLKLKLKKHHTTYGTYMYLS